MTTFTRKQGRRTSGDHVRFSNAMRRGGATVLPPSCLRLLLAVCELADAGGTVTLRRLQRRLGLSPNGVLVALLPLRDAGLVEWEDGRAGTLRPRCTIALWRDA
jgi:DNA-binding transcriptional ArsR family regulator